MAKDLHLALLGNLEARRDGVPVTGFSSSKAQALLCYLVVTGRPHLRPILAGLLWGEMPEASARNNLSKALTNLRQVVGPYLSATRQEVAFNRESPYWLDVEAFEKGACVGADVELLQGAVELYRGDFLEGFYVRQAPAFEEWALAQRARLRELALDALHTLSVHYSQRGAAGHAAGIDYTTRLLALEPWREEAHRQLMLLLARSGQRGAALAQYETCRRVLAQELGVEPGTETTTLYERIRDGKLEVETEELKIRADHAAVRVAPPPFLSSLPPLPLVLTPFVARERELDQLDQYLKAAFAGHGRVAFVTGEAGTGKTALVQEFARRAQERYADLVVASGNCDAHTGVGDPYLPFREILGVLTGDVESRWAAGAISSEQARRLWNLIPHSVQALVNDGPDLVDTFIPGRALTTRTAAAAPGGVKWVAQLEALVAQKESDLGRGNLPQIDLCEQYAKVLRMLARQAQVLLVLDDLQWSDAGTINLLFHLCRRLEGSPILIVGIYRESELALRREGERHPLERVVNEFQRHFGDMFVNLRQADDRQFVECLVDSCPNCLSPGFREALYQHTRGHALFTVEIMRGMQDRGDLARDEAGRWVEGPAVDWQTLPARVEGIIGERIARLPKRLREALAVASVEGETFTAEVIAKVRAADEWDMVRQLSRVLDRRHHLVRSQGSQWTSPCGQCLSRYRFRHILFQKYLYDSLDEAERVYLHKAVGNVLEALYWEQTEDVAVQLARHFSKGGEIEKAIHYLLQAGDQARALYAYQEAIDQYEQALALLQEQGEYERAARTLMKLGLTYCIAFDFRRARQAYDKGFRLWQRAGTRQQAVLVSPAPHDLRVDWPFSPILDPAMAEGIASLSVIEQLFSGLVEHTPELDVVPDVARDWEVTQGGRKYVFCLRDDVRWSDGSSVTAEDFEYAWKRLLDPTTESPFASLLYDVAGAKAYHLGELSDWGRVGVRAMDALTLVVELEGPTSYFPHLLANPRSYPVPRHVVEAHGKAWTEAGNIVTNGPFQLEAWHRGQSIALARNPGYHGQFRGNVHRVKLSLLTEWSDRLERYETDDLDVLGLPIVFSAEERNPAPQRHPGEYVSGPFLQTAFVGFNASLSPFDDIRVRRAFVLATDRETLADTVGRGYVFPATGGFVPPGMPGHSAGIGLPYDPDQARHLLAEAGYPCGRDFPSVVGLTHHAWSNPLNEYLKLQWREQLGVDVTWEPMEWPLFLDRLENTPPQMFRLAWAADYPDPDDPLRASPVRRWTHWQSHTYDGLVAKARQVMDQLERIRLYSQADRILVQEAAIMPLNYARLHLLVKRWARSFPISAIKWVFWKDVIIEPH